VREAVLLGHVAQGLHVFLDEAIVLGRQGGGDLQGLLVAVALDQPAARR